MAETDKHAEKNKVICVNVDEETQRLLSSVKNKSEFIREAVKDKFIYEKFRGEYTNLKEEVERSRMENEELKSENEKIKTERKHFEERIKELTKIKEEYERNTERQKQEKEENKAHLAPLMVAEKPEEVNEEKKPGRTEPPEIPKKTELSQKQGKTTPESDMMKVAKEEIAAVNEKPEELRKEKETENKKIPESDIIKGAKEIYNKYKKYGKYAIKITEKYLQKRGINDTGKINEIIEEAVKNSR